MIELAPFTEDDFGRLIGWIDSARTLQQWGQWRFTYPLDREQLDAYLAETRSDPPARLVFKARLAETGAVVGHAELNDIDLETGMMTIGRVFSPRNAGTRSLRGARTGAGFPRRHDLSFAAGGPHGLQFQSSGPRLLPSRRF